MDVLLDAIQVNDQTKTTLDVNDTAFLSLSGRNVYHNRGYFGQGIKIAVLDTGCDINHPEIKHAVRPGRNFTDYGGPEAIGDDMGHGTHVVGTIAGKVVGIAPQAEIVPVKVLMPTGGEVEWVTAALNYCASRDDIDIISMSLSSIVKEGSAAELMLHQAVKACIAKNIAIICASGNTGKDEILYPAGFYECITVGAIDADRNVAYFTTQSLEVDVCQVGVNVWSAKAGTQGYCTMSGTSMATPIVTGIAALLACQYKIQNKGKRIPEEFLWNSLRARTIDMDIPGVDTKTGTGLCTLNQGFKRISMTLASNAYTIDNTVKAMDVKPIKSGGRIFVPVRFVAEAQDSVVLWEQLTNNNERVTILG